MGMIDKVKSTVTEMGANLGLGTIASSAMDFATNILKGGKLSSYQFEEVEKHFSSIIGQIPTGSVQSFTETAITNLSEPERITLSSLIDSSAREQNLSSYGEANRVDEQSVESDFDEPLSTKPDLLAQRITRIQQNAPQFLSTLASSFLKKKPESSDTTRHQDMSVLQKLLGGIVTAYASSGYKNETSERAMVEDQTDAQMRKGA